MKIQSFKVPTPGDFPNMPEEFFLAIKGLSEQVDLLTRALQGNLRAADNSNGEERTFDLTHNQELVVKTGKAVKGKVTRVEHRRNALYESPRIDWQIIDEDEIRLKAIWPSAPTGTIETVVWIEGS